MHAQAVNSNALVEYCNECLQIHLETELKAGRLASPDGDCLARPLNCKSGIPNSLGQYNRMVMILTVTGGLLKQLPGKVRPKVAAKGEAPPTWNETRFSVAFPQAAGLLPVRQDMRMKGSSPCCNAISLVFFFLSVVLSGSFRRAMPHFAAAEREALVFRGHYFVLPSMRNLRSSRLARDGRQRL